MSGRVGQNNERDYGHDDEHDYSYEGNLDLVISQVNEEMNLIVLISTRSKVAHVHDCEW